MISWRELEQDLHSNGYRAVCGVDEAGRGPLAGPVVAAAVVLPPEFNAEGIADSKLLTPPKRELAFQRIISSASGYAIASADVAEIDQLNILQATFLAMRRAIGELPTPPDFLLIDGNLPIPKVETPFQTVVGGDATVLSIACASILAKVHRDQLMRELHEQYPNYGFDRHKGYATAEHRRMIAAHGALEVHRKSFNLLGDQAKLEFDL
jgi:ribonuclease HII